MARKAYSLDKLLEEINALAPNRSKASDGWLGDAAHAARQSDHNPDKDGVVLAIDITNDPNGGLDCNWLAKVLFDGRNTRINYVIWNKQIYIPFKRSWAADYGQKWQNYTGSNPHTKHLHISVNKGTSDNTAEWQIGDNVYPTEEDLARISAKVGFPRAKINKQDIDYWTKGISNNLWPKGPGTVWRALTDGALTQAETTIAKGPTQTQLDALRSELNKSVELNAELFAKLKKVESEPVEKIVEVPADDSKRSIGDLLLAVWKKLFKIGVR